MENKDLFGEVVVTNPLLREKFIDQGQFHLTGLKDS